MPCWEVNLISVGLKASNRDLLEQALKSLGYSYQRLGNDFRIGSLTTIKGDTITGVDINHINSIRRQYSIETVKQTAKKRGWVGAWRMTGHQKAGNKVVLRKY